MEAHKTPGERLDTLLTALTKIKSGVSQVATRDLLRRMFSKDAWLLCKQLADYVMRSAPVAKERIKETLSAVCRLDWRRAYKSPRDFASCLAHEILDVLGGTAIKIAQVLAHSPGFVPKPLVDACRDSLAAARAPVVPTAVVRAAIEDELGVRIDGLFATFDEAPLASASIAQVHGATLLSGEEVVVKVVRPGVRARLAADLELAALLARATDLLLGPEVCAWQARRIPPSPPPHPCPPQPPPILVVPPPLSRAIALPPSRGCHCQGQPPPLPPSSAHVPRARSEAIATSPTTS